MGEEKRAAVIPAGSIFVVTSGAYSDYTVHSVFRAVADVDTEALIEEYLGERPVQRERLRFNQDEFLAWAFRRGLFEGVDSREWFLSGWGDVEEIGLTHWGAFDPD